MIYAIKWNFKFTCVKYVNFDVDSLTPKVPFYTGYLRNLYTEIHSKSNFFF